MEALVTLEVTDGIATIRLDNPPLNVLNIQVQYQLIALARQADRQEDIRAVVFYGGSRAFAAGADVKEMQAMSYVEIEEHSRVLQELTASVAAIGKPTVAALTGYVLGGGCEVALATDLRFAGDDVIIGLPEVQLGIIPGAGGTQRATRLIGASRAKELIFTGRRLSAEEALGYGLVDQVYLSAEVYDQAVAWAKQFSNAPSLAIRAAKSAIDRGGEVDLATGLEIERSAFVSLFATTDQKVGMEAFVKKGPGQAEFVGR